MLRYHIFLLLGGILCSSATPVEELRQLYVQKLRADPRAIPSYANILSFIWNGPFNFLQDPELFRMQRELLSERFPQDTLAEGRKAIKYYESQFGIDLAGIEDSALLGGNITLLNGAVTVSSVTLDPRVQYNLVSATNLFTATKFNNHISDGGWTLTFNREYQASGKVNRMVPAGTSGFFCNYGIRVGVHADSTLKTRVPGFPGPVLNIHYQSSTAVYPYDPNSLSSPLDCDLFNEYLGPGMARGVFLARGVASPDEIDQNTYLTGGNIITFPKSVPHNVLPYSAL